MTDSANHRFKCEPESTETPRISLRISLTRRISLARWETGRQREPRANHVSTCFNMEAIELKQIVVTTNGKYVTKVTMRHFNI